MKVRDFKLGLKFMFAVGMILIILLGINLFMSLSHQRALFMKQLEEKTKFMAHQLMLEREWGANAYRDKKLQVEPVIMNIEVAKMADKAGLYSIRLISDDALNSEHKPKDDFEKAGLQALEKGQTAYAQTMETSKGKIYRWMTPDKASTEACLDCHAGKKVGDMIGAMSVSVPHGRGREGY